MGSHRNVFFINVKNIENNEEFFVFNSKKNRIFVSYFLRVKYIKEKINGRTV